MFNYPTESFEPFWGPPTATIDWCEENYLFTPILQKLLMHLQMFFLFY